MMSWTSCMVQWSCEWASLCALNGLGKGLGGSDGPEKGCIFCTCGSPGKSRSIKWSCHGLADLKEWLWLLGNDMGLMVGDIQSTMKDRDLWQQCVCKRLEQRLDRWWWEWWWWWWRWVSDFMRHEGDMVLLDDVGDSIYDCSGRYFIWYFELNDAKMYWCWVWKVDMGVWVVSSKM